MDGEEILRSVGEIMTRILIHSQKDEFHTSGDNCILPTTEDGIPIRKLFVGNLAQRSTPMDLQNVFSKYGKVDSCYVRRNIGRSNYAFVTFNTVEDALRAREDGNRKEIHLHNRDLRVMPADSWHQPDSVENQRKLAAKKIAAQKTTEEGTESTVDKLIAEDPSPDDALIHKLNDDCLIHVFLYLPIADRVRIERVCKRWHAVSQQSWRAVKKLDLSLSTWGSTSKTRDLGINTCNLRSVLLRCGDFLNHIDLSRPHNRLQPSTLTIVSKLCPNLQTIDATSLNVSASGIDALLNSCEDLRRLTLGSCTSSCDNNLSKLFSKNTKLRYLKITQNSLLSGKCLVHLPPDAIEEIHLDQCNAVTSCNFSNAVVKFHKLSSLSLYSCVSLNDSAVQAISSCAESLRDLKLCGFFPLISTGVMCNVANLVNLERLKLERNPVVTDDFLIALAAQCVKIKQLSITGCNAVTNEGIAAIASLPKLNDLQMSYMGKVSDDALSHMQQLRQLECRGCPNLTDDGTVAVIQLCPHLELLDLSGCDCITNATLEVAIKATRVRTNNVILKIIIGGTGVAVRELTEISPLLQIVNVDLSVNYMKPDFDHGEYFPSEDDDIDQEDEEQFWYDLPGDRDELEDYDCIFDDWCDWERNSPIMDYEIECDIAIDDPDYLY